MIGGYVWADPTEALESMQMQMPMLRPLKSSLFAVLNRQRDQWREALYLPTGFGSIPSNSQNPPLDGREFSLSCHTKLMTTS
ncbi:hypothetical protein ACTXT7_007895 [Hymenolepis weldensis]